MNYPQYFNLKIFCFSKIKDNKIRFHAQKKQLKKKSDIIMLKFQVALFFSSFDGLIFLQAVNGYHPDLDE